MTSILDTSTGLRESARRTSRPRPLAGPKAGAGSQPDRADAVQGGLADPALIAMLGAVAGHRPEAIRRAVRRHPDGGARVVLHQVQMDPVTVDWGPTGQTVQLDVSAELPLMPYENETNTAYADTAYSGTLWPALLEKGFAALDTTWSATRRRTVIERGYTRLDAGWSVWETAEALAQLTGTRAGVRILHPDTAELTIRYRLAHHSPILIHTPPTSSPGPELHRGVWLGHAYELVTVEPTGANLQLRNPWGVEHPTISLDALFDLTGGVIITTVDT